MKELFRYRYENGPGNETYRRGVLHANCQARGHAILREQFGVVVPSWMRSEEVFFDETKFFRTVRVGELCTPGDIFLWGRSTLADMKFLHWSVYTGILERGEMYLEHANQEGISLWPMRRFLETPRYAKLFAVKRAI